MRRYVHPDSQGGFGGPDLGHSFRDAAYAAAGAQLTSIGRQMDEEITNTYGRALTRTMQIRRNTRPDQMPLWIACSDYPVPKSTKQAFRDVAVNGGRHLHAIALTPPKTQKSRLEGNLTEHFEEHQAVYAGHGKRLFRLHAVEVTHEPRTVVAYAMKSVIRRRVKSAEVLVLPFGTMEREARRDALRDAWAR